MTTRLHLYINIISTPYSYSCTFCKRCWRSTGGGRYGCISFPESCAWDYVFTNYRHFLFIPSSFFLGYHFTVVRVYVGREMDSINWLLLGIFRLKYLLSIKFVSRILFFTLVYLLFSDRFFCFIFQKSFFKLIYYNQPKLLFDFIITHF